MDFYQKNGYCVVENTFLQNSVFKLQEIFFSDFKSKFSDDGKLCRNVIRRFADHPKVVSLFVSEILIDLVTKYSGVNYPIRCGPIVTHYSSNNHIGQGYGLPWHIDYPSMAGARNSVISWLSLTDVDNISSSIEVYPEGHIGGLLRGTQTERGFLVDDRILNDGKSVILNLKAGTLLLMSPFLPHRTFLKPTTQHHKLSISQRFDDFSDTDWALRGFENAYSTQVDRNMYLRST